MSLMNLLSVGKSISAIRDRPTRYRMARENLLPRFGATPGGEPKATEPPDAKGSATPPAPEPPMPPTPLPRSIDESAGTPAPAAPAQPEAVPPAAPSPMTYPRGRWTLLKYPFPRRTAAARAIKGAVQAELSLDSIKVVRNDLSDSDLEVLPAVPQAKAAPTPPADDHHAAAGLMLSRLTARLFGAGRT